jgi:hypothetical protein
MAGGCEDVVTVGSLIGIGAGTGGELNTHGETDEATEKDWVGGQSR